MPDFTKAIEQLDLYTSLRLRSSQGTPSASPRIRLGWKNNKDVYKAFHAPRITRIDDENVVIINRLYYYELLPEYRPWSWAGLEDLRAHHAQDQIRSVFYNDQWPETAPA